jgi:hypothetical protein
VKLRQEGATLWAFGALAANEGGFVLKIAEHKTK